MKADVEQLLPRKKEIILYADMTEQQKRIQDHLINKTFEDYVENIDYGKGSYAVLIVFFAFL